MTEQALTAVVLDDQQSSFAATCAVLAAGGFTVVGRASTIHGGAALVAEWQPDLVVLDLALTGLEGLRVLQSLQTSAPLCTAIVLSPFESLDADARAAGAFALVDPQDLRGLRRAADDLRQRLGTRRSAGRDSG